MDRGAWQLGVDIVATGHNADDIAESVLMNMTRGDVGRLARCTGSYPKTEYRNQILKKFE